MPLWFIFDIYILLKPPCSILHCCRVSINGTLFQPVKATDGDVSLLKLRPQAPLLQSRARNFPLQPVCSTPVALEKKSELAVKLGIEKNAVAQRLSFLQAPI